jgi:hypothetical protein
MMFFHTIFILWKGYLCEFEVGAEGRTCLYGILIHLLFTVCRWDCLNTHVFISYLERILHFIVFFPVFTGADYYACIPLEDGAGIAQSV